MRLEIRVSGRCRPWGFPLTFPARHLIWQGRGDVLAIDAGYGPRPPKPTWQESTYARLFRVQYGPRLPSFPRVLITHHHIDHIGGLDPAIPCTGPVPPLVGGGLQQLRHATFARTMPARQELLPAWTHERCGFPAVGWHDVEVLSMPGHTRNHTGVYFPAVHLLYAADAVWSLDWLHRDRPPGWASALQEDRAAFHSTFQRLRQAMMQDPTLRVRCAHDPGLPEYEVIVA